ncbi:hypothetical protein [Nonomuraea dietziae]|uniref:hypothetical protein n=1 Tax=Nonomuraea dietziae TaxID=65515 RepID=UPI0033DE9E91
MGDDRIATGLAYVCHHAEELRRNLNDDGSDPDKPLQRLRTALAEKASEDELHELLEAIHLAVIQATGDPWGVFGHEAGRSVVVGVAPIEIVYRCPLDRCAGRTRDQLIGEARCEMSGRGLRRERLA